MEPRVEPATKKHAKLVGRMMRKADAEEVWASGHFLPEQACRASINKANEAWAAYADDKLLGICGITIVNNFAVPWALTTKHADTHPLTFWKMSKLIVGIWMKKYPVMLNMIDARHQRALVWLRHLGFVLHPAVPWGAEGRMFVKAVLDSRQEVSDV